MSYKLLALTRFICHKFNFGIFLYKIKDEQRNTRNVDIYIINYLRIWN